jgi:putative transposase
MRAERYTVEQIVAKLRQAERLQGEGLTIPQTFKRLGISDQTFYRWRTRYGALKEDEAQRLKALEQENGRLTKIVAVQALDIRFLQKRRRVSERRACRVVGSIARPSATGASSPPTSEPWWRA